MISTVDSINNKLVKIPKNLKYLTNVKIARFLNILLYSSIKLHVDLGVHLTKKLKKGTGTPKL